MATDAYKNFRYNPKEAIQLKVKTILQKLL